MFLSEMRVNYFDCDQRNLLKLSAAMRYMQQNSSEHLEYLGLPAQKLLEENMVFLLTKMCIKVHRMPVCTQRIRVGTAPIEVKGVRFLREFVIESIEGERLLSALSLWVLVDPGTHKILRPSVFPYVLPLQSTVLDGAIGDFPMPKLPEQKDKLITEIPIRYSHLDVNRHVNNSYYGDFVCDALPYHLISSRELDTVVISFQNEAKWGETICVATNQLAEEEFFLKGVHGGGAACFEAFVSLNKQEHN